MVSIYVVNNGGQWTHRIYRILKELGINTKIISNNTPVEKVNTDSLVLSGGALSMSVSDYEKTNLANYLEMDIPILGICFGMQFIASYFGGKVGKAEVPEYGPVLIKIISKDRLFSEVPDEFIAWENHSDEVKKTNLEIIASSDNCKVQAIKKPDSLIYGVQFHPEVNDTHFGRKIFENFIDIVKDYR